MPPVCIISFRSFREIHIANTVSSFLGILSAQKVPFFKMISHSSYSVDMRWQNHQSSMPPHLYFSSPRPPCARDKGYAACPCLKPHCTVTLSLSLFSQPNPFLCPPPSVSYETGRPLAFKQMEWRKRSFQCCDLHNLWSNSRMLPNMIKIIVTHYNEIHLVALHRQRRLACPLQPNLTHIVIKICNCWGEYIRKGTGHRVQATDVVVLHFYFLPGVKM